jgi:signal transduction histidine kinase
MIAIPIAALWAGSMIFRAMIMGDVLELLEDYELYSDSVLKRELARHYPLLLGVWIGFCVFIMVVIVSTNLFLTRRMIKTIEKPLTVLSNGIAQIHLNNISFRIDYRKNDEFRSVCASFNDMAQRLEDGVRERQKYEADRRELLAGISHDLRTPLTSIKGYVEGLETGVAAAPEARKKYFNTIKSKTVDLEHIIEQLFLFSKLEMDEFPLDMRNIDINRVLAGIFDECSAEYAQRGLDIHFTPPQKTFPVFVDALWLRNAIVNILENSVRYKTKERGQITISLADTDGGVLLRLADDGPGVDALDKLFDAFFRADPSRNRKGSGLGLAISAKIIERMGGSIRAEPSLPEAERGLAIVIGLKNK